MKKIGIMTFHRAHNFGAMLQAYALQQTLSEEYDAQIIDYRCEYIEPIYYRKRNLMQFIKDIAKFFLKHNKAVFLYKKDKHFNTFYKKYLVKTQKAYNKEDICEVNQKFDAFISGSDQVWNPQIIKDDYNYLLSFADANKRYSYAGSFGNNQSIMQSDNRYVVAELLNTFKEPLIRENGGFDVLKNLNVVSHNNAKLVCDPIFLLDREKWINNIGIKKREEKYILLFLVAPQSHSYHFARNLASKLGLKIRYINSYGKYNDCPDWCEDYMNVGPKDFLELVFNATYIVTTSFHGMAFAINFNKEFYFELDSRANNKNDRLINLAEVFDLKDREIKSEVVPEHLDSINYDKINVILKEYSNKSRNILMDSLSNI